MTVDGFIDSTQFLIFQDEKLRSHACQAVDHFLEGNEPVDKSQLYAIPSIILAGGLSGLKDLIEAQKRKNTKKKNKQFWEFISELIITIPEPEFSMRKCIRNELETFGLLLDEASAAGRVEAKKIRKENKARIEQAINHALAIYFEHFNCHYFYRTG